MAPAGAGTVRTSSQRITVTVMTSLDAAGLRALQKPLKDAYRSAPESALNASRAIARLDADGIEATVEGWRGDITAGLHPATRGDGSSARRTSWP